METENVTIKSRVHHGHNLRRLREGTGMKQFTFADCVGMPQQRISKYEAMPVIDDAVLTKFSEALGVPVEVIKNMKEDMPSFSIENNNEFDFEAHSKANANVGNNENNSTNNFDPADKILKLSEEKTQLYERLLKEEQEKSKALEKRLSALEQKITCVSVAHEQKSE